MAATIATLTCASRTTRNRSWNWPGCWTCINRFSPAATRGSPNVNRSDTRMNAKFLVHLLASLAGAALLQAAEYPAPQESDYVIRDFHFRSGESLPELR